MRFPVFVRLALGILLGPLLSAEDSQPRIDKIFADYNKTDSPGCALGVVRDGSFIYRRTYGMASLELGLPLSSASIFYLGSVSKQFTAASVVLAAEQGFLSLDDDVRKYIPELPDYGHTITLREMLHHTSGIRDFLTLLALAGRDGSDIHTDAEIIDLIARQKELNNVPGARYIYSNSNYFLLGVVVKRATGKPLAEFAAENIFRPLGMAHTRYYDDHTVVVPGRVAAYDKGIDGKFLVDWSTGFDIVGAGGLMSSIDDLLLWDKNFYANRLGNGTLLRELQTRGVLNDGKQISYALGLELGEYRGSPVVDHNGALFGYRTEILRFPEQRLTVLCLCNVSSANPTNLTRKVADFYLQGNLQSEFHADNGLNVSHLPAPSLFAGTYLDPVNHFVYSFTASGNTLKAWGADLRRIGPNQFRDLGTGTITFTSSDGLMHATLAMDSEEFFSGDKIEVPRLSAADLSDYAGQYRSTEVDATYSLSFMDGSLVLKFNWDPAIKLEPIAPGQFQSPDLGTIVFQRDANGRVNGFGIYTVNARGVSFVRSN